MFIVVNIKCNENNEKLSSICYPFIIQTNAFSSVSQVYPQSSGSGALKAIQ